MATSPSLDREEYIEQAYFYRVLRERIADNMPAQEVLEKIHQEILATTRLPLAIQFLATEVKHSGLLSSGFARLSHYFTPFQTFLVAQTERENLRFGIETALLILQREAEFRAGQVAPPGLFIFQFECLSRNRLGYDEGLEAMAADPYYNADWRKYLEFLRRQVGVVDFAELVYWRSELYASDQRKEKPDYQPTGPALFGEKEGKIARANRGRDPLYLFAALQRQLGYPEVPRPRPADDTASKLLAINARLREVEMRMKVLDSDFRGQLDLKEFMNKPDLLNRPPAGDES